ncbi:MAG: glycosyltransferase family 9 protein [Desulfonauticus sp.]|nr:glycosyltransferase family 9 protein [Desulfonauticus sp.]
MSDDKYILIRFSSLGDVVLTTGLIYYLGKTLQKKVIVITKNKFSAVFDHNPYVQEIINLNDGTFRNLLTIRKKIIQEYKNIPILDLHCNLRSSLLKFLLPNHPKKNYIKLPWSRRIYLFSQGKIKSNKLHLSVPERYALSYFNLQTLPPKEMLRPKLFLSKEEISWGSTYLNDLGLGKQKFVAIHPYASFTNKTWPKEQWRTYIHLLEKYNIPYVVLGRSKSPLLPHCAQDLTNKTDLRQTMAILALSHLVLSTDSGPLHLGWGLNKPLLGLFGPSDRAWGFFPYGENVQIVQKPVPCRPCSLHGQNNCKYNNQCLTQITPKEILSLTRRYFCS